MSYNFLSMNLQNDIGLTGVWKKKKNTTFRNVLLIGALKSLKHESTDRYHHKNNQNLY